MAQAELGAHHGSIIDHPSTGILGREFGLRRDANGFRPVYPLGNALGACTYKCTFCAVRELYASSTAEDMIRRFDSLHETYLAQIDGPYHPLIYNGGNVTDARECPREVLLHVLSRCRLDRRIRYVSINSREREATTEVLDLLFELQLPFPIHFIFGQESFSPRAATILGKNTLGELDRFIAKLRPYNDRRPNTFGLDVNLIFLPELYLAAGEERRGNTNKIVRGIRADLLSLLTVLVPSVPAEINIHPYHRVPALPYEDADLAILVGILPALQADLDIFNAQSVGRRVHIFVGAELSPSATNQSSTLRDLFASIDSFNRSGVSS